MPQDAPLAAGGMSADSTRHGLLAGKGGASTVCWLKQRSTGEHDMPGQNPLAPLLDFVSELKRCDAADITSASVLMVFVGIDLMAFLSLPAGKADQTKADFIAWADKYVRAHDDQPYQYTGKDLYGARCAALHAFAARSKFHTENPDAKYYGYTDGGKHIFDPTVDERLVIVGVKSLVNDFVLAVEAFLEDIQNDSDIRTRVGSRLPRVYSCVPMLQKQ